MVEFTEIVTEQGSRYRKLPDGTTQRFKTTTEELLAPQEAIVFIPSYQELKQQFPDSERFDEIFGENDVIFEQRILKYAQTRGHIIHIINQKGDRLRTNKEIGGEKTVFLAFGKKGTSQYDFYFPVSKKPQTGYKTFDTRTFKDENGESFTERHIGNPVVEIKV